MSWTDDKVELLRQLWLDGRSASQISAALGHGLTRNAVIGKVHRLGLAGRTKTSVSANSVSSGATRAPPQRRMATRAATTAGGASEGNISDVSANAVAVSSGRVVHGNTVMAVIQDAAIETQPSRIKEEVVVPMSLRVTIIDLKEAMCRWPLGDPASADFRYCGSPTPGASPYCGHHGKLAYQPVQDRRRERDRERRTLIAR